MKYLLLLLVLFTTPSFALTIFVNKDTQMLQAIEDGIVVLESRVVIGKAGRETPTFTDTITHIVTAPYWNVPYNLGRKDVLPKIRKNPSLVRPGNFQVLNGRGQNVSTQFLNNGMQMLPGWRVRQSSGPHNALGSVKFMLEDKMAYGPPIFLHDTNHKEKFALNDRRFSSGCIRVEKAVQLSELLGVKVRGGKERWHKLAVPVRVHVVGN